MASNTAGLSGKRKREDLATKNSKAKRHATGQPAKAKNFANGKPETKSTKESRDVAPKVGEVPKSATDQPFYVQVVTGSYERTLHGIAATIPRSLLNPSTKDTASGESSDPPEDKVTFSDTFLFAAHASSVRCMAVSPPTEADKRYLATGSTDERINVYTVSTAPPTADANTALPALSGNTVTENPRNRSLGSLIHHDRAISRLDFPAKGKLFSSAEDNTVAISRTRDWTVLSSIKAPIPKIQGRPSGDTAGPGETPAGINDFAIHPSQKLMLSVGRGERCLRLWNLMTGKKAGVLNFERNLLEQVGEGKHSSGEGRRVLWDGEGENYTVAFERGAAVFGIDSKPKAVVKPFPPTKLHQLRMVKLEEQELLAASTENGRILFYRINEDHSEASEEKLPACPCVAQLGGREAGVSGRIKDFEIISSKDTHSAVAVVITASSDGAIRFWSMSQNNAVAESPSQAGKLIGTLETGSRVTCMAAFVLDGVVSDSGKDNHREVSEGADLEEGSSSSDGED
ncbi:WD40 repeat-like protein [Hortaea werneckii]|nr:WD40 repeat-like protein [Hortaea werneckii]